MIAFRNPFPGSFKPEKIWFFKHTLFKLFQTPSSGFRSGQYGGRRQSKCVYLHLRPKIFWFHYFCEFDSHPIPREFYLWYAWANDGERKSRPPPWMIFPVSGHITCLREKFRSSQTNAHDLICSVNVLKLLGSSGKKPYSSLLQRERNESAPPWIC